MNGEMKVTREAWRAFMSIGLGRRWVGLVGIAVVMKAAVVMLTKVSKR